MFKCLNQRVNKKSKGVLSNVVIPGLAVAHCEREKVKVLLLSTKQRSLGLYLSLGA